ncbi:helix-turn-helix transcriptional regulator [Acidithiobacillus sp. HP-11]|uniref:helix-turn-helix transcriptional regulator n=1 Tax=Acidithiobacillus sp. HP-11 TaxID=2697656 RepID=UPI0018796587|nr:AlpA family phage regulatory protein [Acidithiobacillus sp. HP-11]MBE7567260.1 AlpA family phage regulatory protein [Acidithiobacillus sp. HP-11]
MENLIVRGKELCKILGISRTTLWRFEKSPDFPEKIQMGPNSVGYFQDDVMEWLKKSKVAKNTNI